MTNQKLKEMKIGDRIYYNKCSALLGYHVITKITKTTILCGDIKFRKDKNNNIEKIGKKSIWDSENYSLENPDLNNKWEHEKLSAKIKAFNFKNLDLEKLKQINNIIT